MYQNLNDEDNKYVQLLLKEISSSKNWEDKDMLICKLENFIKEKGICEQFQDWYS